MTISTMSLLNYFLSLFFPSVIIFMVEKGREGGIFYLNLHNSEE